MPRRNVASGASASKRAVRASSSRLVTSKDDEQSRGALLPGASHSGAGRRRGETARQAGGASRNTSRSRRSRQAKMDNSLKRALDEEPPSENAPGSKRKTWTDPGPSSESDSGRKCGCAGQCHCQPEAVRFSEEPAFEVEVETEANYVDDAQCGVYSFSICDECRARLGKKVDARVESCAMALLELRYGAAARDGGLGKGDCVQHGGPPTEQRSGSRPNGNLNTPLEPTRRSMVISGASDADETMGTLLKLKPGPGCSCRAAGAGTGCHECRAASAATSGFGEGSSGRPAIVPIPRVPAAAGAPDEPRSRSSGVSTSAVVIHLTAGGKAGDGTNSKASAAASPTDTLPVMDNVYAEKNAGPSHG